MRLGEGVKLALRWASDLLFPLECLSCRSEGRLLCEACIQELPKLERPFCPVCAAPGHAMRCDWCQSQRVRIDGIRAPYRMEGVVREAVHRFKYRNLRAAAPELGGLLAAYLAANPIPGEVLAPVPLHRRRLRNRGYNQAELMVKELGKAAGLPVETGLLTRGVDTPPQVGVATREERWDNVGGSFESRGDAVGLKVILVDDVCTTGSTMAACAAVLKDAGAASVWGLALAREG